MIRYQVRQHVPVSPAVAFDFVAVNQPKNHPRWEPEVISVRRDPELKVGTRGVMVRKEWGQTREVPFEVIELIPGRRITYRSGTAPMQLTLCFDFAPKGGETEFLADVELRLSGAMKLLTPLFMVMFPRVGRRAAASMAKLLTAEAAA